MRSDMSLQDWNRARQFMHEQARPLERALFCYHFEDGAVGQVLAELAKFQNPDGGFGHALEPDVHSPDSSVIATTIGLQVLRELRVPAQDEMFGRAIRYLLSTYDPEIKAWIFVPESARNAPHAPWWHFEEYPPKRWENCLGNPRPEILGYLYDSRDMVPSDLRDDLTGCVLDYLLGQDDTMEMHDFLCYLRLVETESLPSSVREPIVGKLRSLAPKVVATDEAAWSKYGLLPLFAAPSPDSPLADVLAEAIQRNLDFELRQQQPDGGWPATWSWGNMYPEVAERVRRDGRSWVSLRTLKALHAFGRVV